MYKTVWVTGPGNLPERKIYIQNCVTVHTFSSDAKATYAETLRRYPHTHKELERERERESISDDNMSFRNLLLVVLAALLYYNFGVSLQFFLVIVPAAILLLVVCPSNTDDKVLSKYIVSNTDI